MFVGYLLQLLWFAPSLPCSVYQIWSKVGSEVERWHGSAACGTILQIDNWMNVSARKLFANLAEILIVIRYFDIITSPVATVRCGQTSQATSSVRPSECLKLWQPSLDSPPGSRLLNDRVRSRRVYDKSREGCWKVVRRLCTSNTTCACGEPHQEALLLSSFIGCGSVGCGVCAVATTVMFSSSMSESD